MLDTSVLVALFRGEQSPAVQRLERLEQDGTPLHIPTVCVQELLQGARSKREWAQLHDNLTTQRILSPVDPLATHVEAARIYYDCRRQGITTRGPVDCLIAQLTLERDAFLLHDDADFERIKEVRPLRTLSG